MKIDHLRRAGNKLRLLDQTRLPGELIYKELDDYRDIIESIKRLEVRGAPAIGIAAAYAVAVAAHQTDRLEPEYLVEVASEIKAARPTAVNLAWAVDRVMHSLREVDVMDVEKTRLSLWNEAEAIHEEDRQMCAAIGRHGAELIQDGWSILTHCNAGALATGGIGTALGVIYTARDQGKNLRVFADETRPLLQGARLTTWELQQEGIEVTLLCDSMAAMLMAQGKVDCVIVGADRVASNGDAANKIGTYSVAVLAREHNIPFYVAAPMSTWDMAIESGEQIPIEERGADEITSGFGKRTAPEGTKVYSPAFDVTPIRLITAHITDEGVKAGGRAG
ncbi:MAG: S-methyl-5-thioribose-1-phosphate isomerase [Candidatus Zixiibacteriota bacterium]|nr:MAG: S-methyl-5-thioribose-1-phosphate isomerase [candidate division Zixibacteria bacterium]